MGSTQQFSLKWNKYQRNWDSYLTKLKSNHLFSDVMVACDGEVFQLHRIVLASCSNYFENALQNIPTKETPIVMLSEITEVEMRTLIDFMYCGEATIDQSQLEGLLKAAERLQIKGLVKSEHEEESDAEEDGAAEEAESAEEAEPSYSSDDERRPSRETPPPPLQQAPLAGKSDLGDDGENASSLSLPSAASPPLVPPPADLPPRVTLTRQLPGEEGGAGRPPPPLLPYQNGHHLFPMPAMQDTPPFGSTKRNTPDSPHVLAALRQISAGQITVAEASIQYDIPIPTLYVNMRRQGVKARGRVGMAGKRKPRGVMSVEMRNALEEIRAGTITASKASRKYNITLPRLVSWMRKTGVRSAYAKGPQLLEGGPPPQPPLPPSSLPTLLPDAATLLAMHEARLA